MIPPSTRAFYRNAALNMADLRGRAVGLQSQIGTGQRLNRSSDDPVAAAQLRMLARNDALTAVHEENASRTGTDLEFADSALSSFADYVVHARELAMQAASGVMSDKQRAYIGQELQDIRQGMLSLSNSRDAAGFALFGGENDQQAYKMDPLTGTIGYVGSGQAGEVSLGDGQSVTRAVTGPEFLTFNVNGTSVDLFGAMGTLAAAMSDPTADPVAVASDALGTLDKGLQSITTAQTVVGARLNWIDFNTARYEKQSEMAAEQKSSIGGADIAATITELQQTMTVLEASQASFAKLASLSLFSMIN